MGGIQVTPYRPESESLLDQVTKMTALKNAQQESALKNQEVIAATQQNEQTQAVNSAYHDALTTDDQGNVKIDSGKLSQSLAASGHGSAVPGILKNVQDYQKSTADLTEAQQKVQSMARDSLGYIGAAIQKANYDPHLADLMIEQRLRTPGLPPQEAQQIQQYRSQIQQNPGMLKQLVDNMVAQSGKQQEFQNAKDVANIRSQSEGKMQMAAWLRDNPTRKDGTPTDASDYQKFLNQQGIDATVAKETNPAVLQAKKDLAVTTAQAEAPTKIATAAKEAEVKQQIEGRAKLGYAYDPSTNRTIPVSQTDYLNSAGKLQAWRPVTEKEYGDDRQMNNRLADVAQKIKRYEDTLQTDLSPTDKALFSNIVDPQNKLKVGVFHTELPFDSVNQFMKSVSMNALSPAGQKRLIAYRNAEEAMVGYQRVLSGSGRSSDKAMELNVATLPHPMVNKDYGAEALSQFKENIKIASQQLPSQPGLQNPDDVVKSMSQPTRQAPSNNGGAKKILTRAAIRQAAKDNGISEIQAESQARAQGYDIQ